MNREIKFRAIAMSGGWVYGNFIHSKRFEGCFNEFRIHEQETGLEHDVYIETLGCIAPIVDNDGNELFDGDIIKVGAKHGFNSELLNEFKELNNLESINGIGLHFIGIVEIDLHRGLMFKNPKNRYREPMFTRHIDIFQNHSDIVRIGNIHENPELLT